MSEHWLSGYARSAAIIGVSALLFVNAAYAKIVVVDAGHGGQVRPGPYCSEDDLNLSVSNAVLYLLDGDPYTYFVATRTTDVAIAIRYRVAYADDVGADGFMSLHHNDLAQLESEAIYSNSDKQAGYWGTYSQQLAITIGNNLCFGFSQPKGYPCRGTPCTDLVCSGYTDSVLAENSRIASVGEPFGLRSTEAQKMCDAANYPDEVLEEANAYAQGLASYFDQVAVGTSFTATGGSQRITLQWVESDPGRSVAYAIYRGSSCWGPFDEYIGQVYSQDHTYTPDNMHYTYVDTTVAYSRTYWYQLRVAGENPTASAIPSGLASSSPPVTPTGLVASGVDRTGYVSTVTLTWNASGGATGYYVYRSRFSGMPDCNSRREDLGTVANPTFQDDSAPTGTPLFYRVRAFNQSNGSGVSNEATVQINRTVAVEESPRPLSESVRFLGPNPTHGGSVVQYVVANPSHVRCVVYDIAGRRLYEPLNRQENAGVHRFEWDGRLTMGGKAPTGIYFLVFSINDVDRGGRRLVVLR